MKYFTLQKPNIWGDYGDVLVAGYYCRDGEGPMLLHRTGPFVPPISFPWDSVNGSQIVVTSTFLSMIKRQSFVAVQSQPAIKERIIRSKWHTWDRASDSPKIYPRSGEPEDYILNMKHEPAVAKEMEELFELVLPVIESKYEKTDPRNADSPLRAVVPNVSIPQWFRTRANWGDFVVSDSVRDWLESHVGEWVTFETFDYRIA